MICHKCGADTPDDSAFCSKCGVPLSAAANSSSTGKERYEAALASRGADLPEHEIWQGSYSAKAMIGGWVLCGLATIVGIVVGVLFPPAWIGVVIVVPLLWIAQALTLLYRRLSVRYRLTTRGFFQERGILYRSYDRVEVIRIKDIAVVQGPIERMLGVGTLQVMSSDVSDGNLSVPGIADVRAVAAQLDEARRDEQQRRGISMKEV